MSTSGKAARSSFMRTDWSEPAWLPPPMWLIESLARLPGAAGAAAAAGLVGSAAAAGLGASVGLAGAAGAGGAGVGAAPPQAATMAAPPARAAALTNARRLVDRPNDIACSFRVFFGYSFIAPSITPRMK